MPSNGKIRVIKRGQQQASKEETAAPAAARAEAEPARSVKTVVSGWVREHQQRAEEFRSNYTALLRDVGFKAPGNCISC